MSDIAIDAKMSTQTTEADTEAFIPTNIAQAAPAGTTMPNQASLLGLPAEMRLRIYKYLLDAGRRAIPESSLQHCCYQDLPAGSMKCGCANTVHLSILSVSKFVHQEAISVLYNSVEIRIDTPEEWNGTALYDHYELLNSRFEDHLQQSHITSLVAAFSTWHIPIKISDVETDTDLLKPLWSELGARLCNIKTFRLYLRYAEAASLIDNTFDYDELLGFLDLPKLKRLILEIFVGEDFNGPTAQHGQRASGFLCTLKQKAAEKISELGRDIEIVGFLRERAID